MRAGVRTRAVAKKGLGLMGLVMGLMGFFDTGGVAETFNV